MQLRLTKHSKYILHNNTA